MKFVRSVLLHAGRPASTTNVLGIAFLVGCSIALFWIVQRRRMNLEFIEAIKTHDTRMAVQMLESGADPNSVDSVGTSMATTFTQFVRHLVHPRSKSPSGPSALLILFDGSLNRDSGRPIDMNLLNALLNKGADPNVSDPYDLSPLEIVGHSPYMQLEVARALLDRGASVNRRNSVGDTAMLDWSVLTDPQLVELLVNRGGAIDARATTGETPLIRATRTNRLGTVKVLVRHGAQVGAADSKGRTAEFYARSAGFTEISDVLRSGLNSTIHR